MSENLPARSEGNFLFYQSEDGKTRVRVLIVDNTVWLSQRLMAELYDTSVANINIHLRNIFEDGELGQDSVIKKYLITAQDGKNYRTKCYSLDAILAVGYRVRSPRGTQFRRWATETLREFLIKGFVLDDERLNTRPATSTTLSSRRRNDSGDFRRRRTAMPSRSYEQFVRSRKLEMAIRSNLEGLGYGG